MGRVSAKPDYNYTISEEGEQGTHAHMRPSSPSSLPRPTLLLPALASLAGDESTMRWSAARNRSAAMAVDGGGAGDPFRFFIAAVT